jgi:type 1 glutamine amidotransferase
MKQLCWIITAVIVLTIACGKQETQLETSKLKALIIDGQNNHYVWPKTTMMMRDYLEQTNLFEVDIYRMDSVWLGTKYNKSRPEAYTYFIETFPLEDNNNPISEKPVKTSRFDIDFSQYDVVVSNLGAAAPMWPDQTKKNFEKYISDGGGLVIVHAANNIWGDWIEFNKMIGLGAWGGRDSTTGPFVYYTDEGKIEMDSAAGRCGSHGPEFDFLITTQAPEHPIMKGLPAQWMHAQDELYEKMRGPFENATILATAYSDVEGNAPPWNPEVKGMGQHVATLMAINYGKGRIFHTTLGHFDYSMECAGFIITLQRGSEWAATGKVTQDIPDDFPDAEKTVSRKWK